MPMGSCSAWRPRRAACASLTSPTRSRRWTRRASSRIRIRSTLCTTGCCPSARCGLCWPTIRVRARRSCRGLLIRELMLRGDVERCLIVAPGSLVEQWQDELADRFGLRFEVLSRATVEASYTGNPFAEKNLLIARLDQLARAEDLQARLRAVEWDLVIVDEAHKMAAHSYGAELRRTKRFRSRRVAARPEPPPAVANRHAPQRQERGLPGVHVAGAPGPVRGSTPRPSDARCEAT